MQAGGSKDKPKPIREPGAPQMGCHFQTLRAWRISPLTVLEGFENQGDSLRPSAWSETKSASAEWTTFISLQAREDSVMGQMKLLFLSLGIVLAIAGGAMAEQAERFTMTPVEEGMLRFDSQTGTVSLCRRHWGQWSCDMVPDNARELQRKIESLEEGNAVLRAEIEQLKSAPALTQEDLASKKQDRIIPKPRIQMPDDDTIDEMIVVLEKMVRRFQDMFESMQPDEGKKQL